MRTAAARRLPRSLRRIVLRAADSLDAARGSWSARRAPRELALPQVRRRLEVLVTALYNRGFTVEAAPALPSTGALRTALELPRRFLRPRAPLASLAGRRILLPATVPAAGGAADALSRYRVIVVSQAERAMRDTAAHLPSDAEPLVRDLYLLAESAAVDRALAERAGSGAALRTERARALTTRPPIERLRAAERAVERLVRSLLAADPAMPDDVVPTPPTPQAALGWARETAAGIARADRYRGVAPVEYWGARPVRALRAAWLISMDEQVLGGGISLDAVERATLGGDAEIDADAQIPEDAQLTAGEQAGGPPSESGPPEAGTGDSAEGRDAAAGGPSDPDHDPLSGRRLPPGTSYPEWDVYVDGYRPGGATVRPGEPDANDSGAWATEVLGTHAPLVRLVRQRFERLRARRLRLGRQREGDELDVPACVDALVAVRAGQQPDDRLYAHTRPASRGLAVLLLVDASGSTESEVSSTLRVFDVERVAVLLASEAFEALGDLFAVHAFSGVGAHNVRVTTLQAFGERNAAAVRRRVSAMKPEGNTRLGAAVRHATALLASQPAGHRLLIILSDGRPNDMGGYQGDYAVEDSRRAVIEARASGVRPFYLTVDAEAPEYLARIFGPAGHTLVTHPDHVPDALLALVRQLVTA